MFRATIRSCSFDYSHVLFRLLAWRLSSSRISLCAFSAFRALSTVVAVLFAVRINACLWLVGFLMRSYNIRIVYCPLMSACVRVLTFRHIFLTVCLLSSFAEKASSKSGEISDGVLLDREVEQCLLGIAIA